MIDHHPVARRDGARDVPLAIRHPLHVVLLQVPSAQHRLRRVRLSGLATPGDVRVINLLVPDERVAPSLHLDARDYLLDGAFVPVSRERGDDLGVSGSVGRRAHLSRAFHDADRLLRSIRHAPRVRGDVMRADVGLLPSLAHTLENILGVLRGAHVSQYGGEGGVGLEGWAMAVREEALELGPRLLGVDDAAAGLSSHGGQLLGGDVHGPAR